VPSVTKIEPQKKKKDRFNISLDGVFAFGLSAELAYLNRLKVGKVLTGKEIKELIQKDQTERLTNKALHFLGYRPRSEKEIRDHLTYKGKLGDLETEEEKLEYLESIEQALKKLKELGYLNDKEFAAWWVKERGETKSVSERILKNELLMKGVDREILAEALKSVDSEEDKAMKIATKKARFMQKLDKNEFRLKLSQFLDRKGFEWETVKKVVDSLQQKG
jgi:regulatory protein